MGQRVNNPPTKPTCTHHPPQLGLIPCDPDTCDWLYRMGQLDAMAWAESTGIAAAAKAKAKAKGVKLEAGVQHYSVVQGRR